MRILGQLVPLRAQVTAGRCPSFLWFDENSRAHGAAAGGTGFVGCSHWRVMKGASPVGVSSQRQCGRKGSGAAGRSPHHPSHPAGEAGSHLGGSGPRGGRLCPPATSLPPLPPGAPLLPPAFPVSKRTLGHAGPGLARGGALRQMQICSLLEEGAPALPSFRMSGFPVRTCVNLFNGYVSLWPASRLRNVPQGLEASPLNCNLQGDSTPSPVSWEGKG